MCCGSGSQLQRMVRRKKRENHSVGIYAPAWGGARFSSLARRCNFKRVMCRREAEYAKNAAVHPVSTQQMDRRTDRPHLEVRAAALAPKNSLLHRDQPQKEIVTLEARG